MKIRVACMCALLFGRIAAAQSAPAPEHACRRRAAKAMLTISGRNADSAGAQAGDSQPRRRRTEDPVVRRDCISVCDRRAGCDSGGNLHSGKDRAGAGAAVTSRDAPRVLIHFTSMIYPNGYTVMLGGSIENTPGAEKTSMKDSEGTIRQDSDAGKKPRRRQARLHRSRDRRGHERVEGCRHWSGHWRRGRAGGGKCSRAAPT